MFAKIKFYRIWAIVLRYLYATRDPSRISEFLFWPMIDIGFFGLIAYWAGNISGNANVIQPFITGLVLWQIIYRANAEVCINIMDEFIDQNMVNLIASPVKRSELVLAMMLSGLLKIVFTILYGSFIGWIFYRVNIFEIGFMIFPFTILCLLSGWITGLIAAGILVYKGSKFPQLPWVIITIAALVSTIFYPLSVLPHWFQLVCKSLPMTHIFESMRQYLMQGTVAFESLIISLILAIIYLTISISFFLFMFEKSRKKGFSRIM